MYDVDTIKTIIDQINKKISNTKEYALTGVDNMEELLYARGKYNAYIELLQDLRDLLKKEDNIYDIERK